MSKDKIRYVCLECGYESLRWMGKCPECSKWNTFIEEKVNKKMIKQSSNISRAVVINDIKNTEEFRNKTNIEELDRVLGGGIVKGSLILLGGAPGIGKSTLLLQICKQLANDNFKILYVSGEESKQQLKIRADRLEVKDSNLFILSETNMDFIIDNIDNIKPDLLIIDSIQTMYNEEVSSMPGSVSQVRESTNKFLDISKNKNISTIIVGHVTKEGSIAGPRVLEHMVDTVLYFESTKNKKYRMIRTIKNRFGSTNELGVFEMSGKGLIEVNNPSKIMLDGKPEQTTGSVVTASIEGTRAMLHEVQTLVTYTKMNIPRRTAIGYDSNRLAMLIAVIEKHLSLNISQYDVYLNIAGNMKISDPGLDLAIIVALMSSFKDVIIPDDVIIVGEVGLSGEVRTVVDIENRLKEAMKMGFNKCVIPYDKQENIIVKKDIKISKIKNIREIGKKFLNN